MVVELPVSEVDQVIVNNFASLYHGEGHIVSEAVRGDEEAGEVLKAFFGDTYGQAGALRDHGVFREISHDEVDGDFLKEVKAPYAPVKEDTTIYVPSGGVEEYSRKASELCFAGEVHSIEARALVHEERMRQVYEDEGTVVFKHPADTGEEVNFFGTDGRTKYDSSPDTLDISRIRGKPVYDRNTRV